MDISPAYTGLTCNENGDPRPLTDTEIKALLIQAGIEGLQARAGYVPGVDIRDLPSVCIEMQPNYYDAWRFGILHFFDDVSLGCGFEERLAWTVKYLPAPSNW